VLWRCWLGHVTCKIVSEMAYNVSSGTVNPTIPIPRCDEMRRFEFCEWHIRELFFFCFQNRRRQTTLGLVLWRREHHPARWCGILNPVQTSDKVEFDVLLLSTLCQCRTYSILGQRCWKRVILSKECRTSFRHSVDFVEFDKIYGVELDFVASVCRHYTVLAPYTNVAA